MGSIFGGNNNTGGSTSGEPPGGAFGNDTPAGAGLPSGAPSEADVAAGKGGGPNTAAAAAAEGQAPPPNPAVAKAGESDSVSGGKSNQVSRDTARQRQESLGSGANYRRSTLLGGLLGLSDANLTSARKTLLGA